MKGPLEAVEISYFLHATEDPEKVRSAVARLTGSRGKEAVEEMKGHFGNTIVRVVLRFEGPAAESAFKSIGSLIPAPMKLELQGGLEARIDDRSTLYLRFDKQGLVSGEMSEGATDSVRVKVKPRGFLARGGARSFFSAALEKAA